MKHVGDRIVDAELRYACGERIGQLAGKIRFPDNPEIFPGSVNSL